jgi:biopolymer transport protein ExbD
MLTSTFVKKEPVQIATPASVSEIKIPEKNILSILIDTKGRVFMGLDRKDDMAAVLESMGEENGITFTPDEIKKFSIMTAFGLPIKSMKQFLNLPQQKQDELMGADDNPGIPTDSLDNQFKSWVRLARDQNPDLRIAIKADAKTPYSVIKKVMNALQDLKENRYNLITNLKKASDAKKEK